jgi:Zn-finger nucleic acid-binding protein
MTDAQSLHCPNCGAAADPQATRCPYCKARLATISCPTCFALMFEGTRFCPQCGTPSARVEQETTDLRCPACRNSMQHVSIGAASVLECGRCDGVWLDAADFERICADRESRAAVLHRWTSAPPAGNAPQHVRYRPCVRCGKMMNRVNFGRLSGTVVDVCRGHGTFLDPGELHAIAAFIEAGGLDRMREREIQDLKDEQRRLTEAEAALARRSHTDYADANFRTGWSVVDLLELIDSIHGD